MDELGLRTLTIVLAVAKHLSFRGAATELAISPSSVSHVVASFERRLGIRLLQRNTRSVSLTAAGEAFLARVRPAVAEINDAIDDAHGFRDRPAGLVRLNASSWGAERIFPLVLGFMRTFPDVQVDLVTEGRLVDIIAGGFDAGVRQTSVVPQEMIALPIGIAEAMILIAAPDYLKRRGTPRTPGDLLKHDCIRARLPSGAVMRWELGQGADQLELDAQGSLLVGTTQLAARAAASGSGIGYVEVGEAQPWLDAGSAVQLMPTWTPSFDSAAIYYPSQRLTSAAFRAFVSYCKERLPVATPHELERACGGGPPARLARRPRSRSRASG